MSAAPFGCVVLACVLLASCGDPGPAVLDVGVKACAPHGGLNTAEKMIRVWDVQFQCKDGVLILWKAPR